MIVGIGGEKKAGKSTAAECLVNKHGFTELSFAHPLKKMCAEVFDISSTYFTDPELKDQPFAYPLTITEDHISAIVNLIGATEDSITLQQIYALAKVGPGKVVESPRKLLQFIGTDLIRECISQDFWVKALKHDIGQLVNVVIPDVRFASERAFLRSIGATLALIDRPGHHSSDSHSSENSLGDKSEYDVIVINDGSIEELHNNLDHWYGEHG
jgi:hypothetical protein